MQWQGKPPVILSKHRGTNGPFMVVSEEGVPLARPCAGPTMLDRRLRCSRRKFLASAAALTLSGAAAGDQDAPQGDQPLSLTRPARLSSQGRKPLAVVCTVYRPLSH